MLWIICLLILNPVTFRDTHDFVSSIPSFLVEALLIAVSEPQLAAYTPKARTEGPYDDCSRISIEEPRMIDFRIKPSYISGTNMKEASESSLSCSARRLRFSTTILKQFSNNTKALDKAQTESC
jgi:hypothetical protein